MRLIYPIILMLAVLALESCSTKRGCPASRDYELSKRQIRKNRRHKPDMKLFSTKTMNQMRLKGD